MGSSPSTPAKLPDPLPGLAFTRRRRYLRGLTTSVTRLADRPSGPGRLPETFMARCLKVAKVNPGEFIRQVRAESAKIVWPTRRETMMTGVMVVIMTTLLAIFFFGVDSAFSAIVQALLGLIG